MTVRWPSENLMRVPFEVGWSPARSRRTPAFISSSLYLPISPRSSSLGIMPASDSLLALTIIMNRMTFLPTSLVCAQKPGSVFRRNPLSISKSNGAGRNRQPIANFFGEWFPPPSTQGLFIRQTLNLDDRPYFHGAPTAGGNTAGDVDGLVEVLGIDHKEAAKLFAGFPEGPIGEPAVVVLNPNARGGRGGVRSEEHTSELQSRQYLVCRLLLEKRLSTGGDVHCGHNNLEHDPADI